MISRNQSLAKVVTTLCKHTVVNHEVQGGLLLIQEVFFIRNLQTIGACGLKE